MDWMGALSCGSNVLALFVNTVREFGQVDFCFLFDL